MRIAPSRFTSHLVEPGFQDALSPSRQAKGLRLVRGLLLVAWFLSCARPAAAAADAGRRRVKPHTRAFFERAQKRVKRRFYGLDQQIDQVFRQVEDWYLDPAGQTRRKVVFLTGLTSTGKSAVVRAVCEELRLMNGFRRFSMRDFAKGSDERQSLQQRLVTAFKTKRRLDVPQRGGKKSHMSMPVIEQPERPVLFFDEVTHIATRGPTNNRIENPQAAAFWDLLEDAGELVVENPTHIWAQAELAFIRGGDQVGDPADPQYERRQRFAAAKKVALDKVLAKQPPQTTLDLRGSLVFVAANLEEILPQMTRFRDPEKYGADHVRTAIERTTTADVQNGMYSLFFEPEVGRLGSEYVLFPTLSSRDFRSVIKTQLGQIRKKAKQQGIELKFSTRFKKRIYREGVRATLGPRPLLGVIASFAQDPLGRVKSEAGAIGGRRTRAGTPVRVTADVEPNAEHAIWTVEREGEQKQLRFSIPSQWARSNQLKPEPVRSVAALHVAAETILEIAFRRRLPERIKANSIFGDRLGVVSFATDDDSYPLHSEFVQRLAVLLGPKVAERLTTGEGGLGVQDNLIEASRLGQMLVGRAGLGPTDKDEGIPDLTSSAAGQSMISPHLRQDVEWMLKKKAWPLAQEVLLAQVGALRALIDALLHRPVLKRHEVARILRKTWSDPAFIVQASSNKGSVSKVQQAIHRFVKGAAPMPIEDSGEVFGLRKKGD